MHTGSTDCISPINTYAQMLNKWKKTHKKLNWFDYMEKAHTLPKHGERLSRVLVGNHPVALEGEEHWQGQG